MSTKGSEMGNERVVYTDGHGVEVTETRFEANGNTYLIQGITGAKIQRILENNLAGVIMLILGVLLFFAGWIGVVGPENNVSWTFQNFSLNINHLLMAGGILLLISGIVILARRREKYAVRIRTAEGEKDVLISDRRSYIEQIVDALNRVLIV